jgi:uncharacterized membrane protein YeaQ/YmgE (transglycosylase-associated protein family)
VRIGFVRTLISASIGAIIILVAWRVLLKR